MSASVRTPDRVAGRHQRLARAARESSSRLHERAAARLHVEHQRVDPLGDLLAHDRRGDERDALDGAGHVAQRVELLVGRRDLGGLPDHARSRPSSSAALHLVERQVDAEAGNRLAACRACRRCGRGRGPTSSARRTPHAAASGARTSDVLSPTPPVLCLSTLTPGMADRSSRDARPHHGVGQPGRLLRRHPAQHDGHEQRGGLVVGERAVGDAGHEELDVLAG